MNSPAYLDHNASSPMRRAVIDAMVEAMAEAGNASSVHAFGRRHRQYVEAAREEVAALAGVRTDRVVFTGGGTEANNLALSATGRWPVYASTIEHDSVLRAADDIERLPVGSDGVVELRGLKDRLAGEAPLVAVMYANNETGVIQPVADVVALAGEAGALVHTDTVQAAGRVPLDIGGMGAATASLSAHKIGGPQGVGALVLGEDLQLSPSIRGGGQERGRRAGTENTAGIVGFGVAARLALGELAKMAKVAALRDRLEAQLRQAFPDVAIFGHAAPRLPNTSCFAIPGMRSETQVMALDLAGIGVSAGSACSSGKVTPSHVLRAMGVPEAIAECAIRVSLGTENTDEEVARVVAALAALRGRTIGRAFDAA